MIPILRSDPLYNTKRLQIRYPGFDSSCGCKEVVRVCVGVGHPNADTLFQISFLRHHPYILSQDSHRTVIDT